MQQARAMIARWLLVLVVIALCANSVLSEDGSGNTPGDGEKRDYTSCANTPKRTCGCDCDVPTSTDCTAEENKQHCRSYSPTGVTLSFAQSFAFIDDDGPNASPVGSSCASCSNTGATIPDESQLPRVQMRRIWRSAWVTWGSFGFTMYSSYDYIVRSSVQSGFRIFELMDPNSSAEAFRDEGGGVYIPVGFVDYHTKVAEVTDTYITFVQLDGRRLRFEWTGYIESGVYRRARLQYIEDRNGNRINFTYLQPATDTTPDVFMWATATDSYNRSLQFRYTAWQGHNVIDQVTLPDARKVTYNYEASKNSFFPYKVDYGDRIESTWEYDDSTKIHKRNDALLPPDHFKQTILTSHFVHGRTRYIKRADGTLLYSRTDSFDQGMNITDMYDRGETFEIKSSPTKTLISHRQQRVDGTWEDMTSYAADDTRPVKEVAQPDGRKWDSVRDDSNDRITYRKYPDGSDESFTFNEFAQMTSHTHRSGAIEIWRYDTAGNLLSHTEAAGVAGVEATESWKYNSRGQVETHTDFNGNVTQHYYYGNGDLHKITLPASDGQPAGTITFTYDGAGRIETIEDPMKRLVSFHYDSAGRLIETKHGDDSTEEMIYGEGEFSARMLSKKDRNGNHTRYEYDNTGRVLTTKVEEANSQKILTTMTNTWDAPTGRLMAMNRDRDVTEYTYDYKGRVLTTTVHPESDKSLTTTNDYDQYHLRSTTDAYGRRTFYLYDKLDRMTRTIRETVPNGVSGVPDDDDLRMLSRNFNSNAPYLIEDFEHDAQGRRKAYVDGRGIRYEYGYDARDRRTLERSAVGTPAQAEESYTYDGNNNQLTMKDKNQGVWPKTYTARNKVLTEANPLGHTSKYTYYDDGLLKSATNPSGHTTTFIYDTCCGGDSGGRLKEIIDADGNKIQYEYDPNGNRTQVTDQSGRIVKYDYDGLNRQTTMTVDPQTTDHPRGLNLQTLTAYDQTPDAVGRKETVTSPAGQPIETTYDALGRVRNVAGNTPHMAYTYDVIQDGLLKTTTTDANNHSQSSMTDGAGRTLKTIDGLGHAMLMEYDNNNNLVLMTDRDARRTRYGYDERNRRTSEIADEGGINAVTRYQYDPVGNLKQITDAESKVTKYEYDAANRRRSATYGLFGSRALVTREARTWRYQYTPHGQLRQLAKPKGVVINYTYDNLERLWTRTYLEQRPRSRAYTNLGTDVFTYHANSLLKTAVGGLYDTKVDRANLDQDYDQANRMLQERQDIGAGAKKVEYTYHPDSLIDQITYPGGTAVQHTYTSRRELNEVKIGGVAQATHTYDPGGRRTSRTYVPNGRTTNWAYDAADRITGLNHAGVQAWNYRYTSEGDQLVQDDRTTPVLGEAYAYDGLHRLIDNKRGVVVGNTVPGQPNFMQNWSLLDKVGNWKAWNNNGTNETRTHNNHHALTGRSTVPLPQAYDGNLNQTDDGASSFILVYDANDLLKEVKLRTTGAVLAQYRYDAFGRRVEKSIADTPNRVVRYYYSGLRIIEERDGSDAVTATYTYGSYIDEPLTMDRGGQRYYYHSNRLYSTYALTDARGSIVERYVYTPYGEVTTFDAAYQNFQFASRVSNPFTFTGRELDAETGLMHFRARTYDTVQGRFKQRDPAEYTAGLNLYAGYFVPNKLDPTGLWPVWACFNPVGGIVCGVVAVGVGIYLLSDSDAEDRSEELEDYGIASTYDDKNVNINVRECEVVLYIGHGFKKTPVKINLPPSGCAAGGYLGCWPGDVNPQIPPEQRIQGVPEAWLDYEGEPLEDQRIINGLANGTFWEAQKGTINGAKNKAQELCRCCTTVTVRIFVGEEVNRKESHDEAGTYDYNCPNGPLTKH